MHIQYLFCETVLSVCYTFLKTKNDRSTSTNIVNTIFEFSAFFKYLLYFQYATKIGISFKVLFFVKITDKSQKFDKEKIHNCINILIITYINGNNMVRSPNVYIIQKYILTTRTNGHISFSYMHRIINHKLQTYCGF